MFRLMAVTLAALYAVLHVYGDPDRTPEQKVVDRMPVIAEALRDFDDRVAPELEALTFAGFRNQPVNNATLLSRIRYYNRLADFDAFLASHDGDLIQALADLRARAPGADDAFDLLPDTRTGTSGPGDRPDT